MIDRLNEKLSLTRQCQLLGLSRSSLYYHPANDNREDLALMALIDRQFMETPYYGSRKMTAWLRRAGHVVNRKRVRRLMRQMGLQVIWQKPNTSKPNPEHKIYPYLLRGLKIDRPNQVWATDITYIPMPKGFFYLVAIMDWHSRKVLTWRLSNTMDATFCVEALEEALATYGRPEIFNSDQGAQFTSTAFTGVLEASGVRISMDGKGRCMGGVDDWRGGGRSRGVAVDRPLSRCAGASFRAMAPFPVAARQTGRADRPHPAFSCVIKPSRSAGRRAVAAGHKGRVLHKGTRPGIGGTRRLSGRCGASTSVSDAARHTSAPSHRSG
jgi:putative transposase